MKLAADSCQLKLSVAWDWAGALPPCHKCICNWWPCMRNGQDSPERLEIVSGACQMALKWPGVVYSYLYLPVIGHCLCL